MICIYIRFKLSLNALIEKSTIITGLSLVMTQVMRQFDWFEVATFNMVWLVIFFLSFFLNYERFYSCNFKELKHLYLFRLSISVSSRIWTRSLIFLSYTTKSWTLSFGLFLSIAFFLIKIYLSFLNLNLFVIIFLF